MKPKQMDVPPDGGYGWVVLAACVICQGMVASLQRISGLILVEVMDVYHIHRTGAFSMMVMFRLSGFLFAPIVGKILTKFPYRVVLCTGSFLLSVSLILTSFTTTVWQLILVYGCMRGFANNCVITASSLSAGIYFQERRSLAMGTFYGALAIIEFISPILFQWLVETYDFHGAILIYGGITLHGCAFGMLVRQPSWVVHSRKEEHVELLKTELNDEDTTNNEDNCVLLSENYYNNRFKDYKPRKIENGVAIFKKLHFVIRGFALIKEIFQEIWRDLRLFKDGLFLIQLISRSFSNITLTFFITLLPDYVGSEFDNSITKQDIAYILSMSSIGEIILRFGVGFLLDKLPWKRKYSLAGVITFIGITVYSFQFMESYTHLMLGILSYSMLRGMNVVIQYLVAMDNMGVQRIHMARGFGRFGVGFFTVISGLLIGHLRDQLGSYKICLAILGGSSIFGGLVWTAEPIVLKYFPSQMNTKRRDAEDDFTE